MTRVLWIDDQPDMIEGAIRLVKELGISVVLARSVADGVREYNRSCFDAVILDRHVPRGEVLWPTENVVDSGDEHTGEALLIDLRDRYHLAKTPIVFYTQYDSNEFRDSIEAQYENVKVVSKDQFGDDLANIIFALVEMFPVNHDQVPEIKITDHFSVAQYFVTNKATNSRVAVQFAMEPSFVRKLDTRDVHLHENFAHYCEVDETLVEVVLAAGIRRIDGVLGLYYTGRHGSGDDWRNHVLLATIRKYCFDTSDREIHGVGKAMVVRFLRECMRELNYAEDDVCISDQIFAEIRAEIHPTRSIRPFLIKLGFESTERANILRIPYSKAVSLIREVSSRAL